MAYMNRGRNLRRDDFYDKRDSRGFGVQELYSKSLFIQSKKFYVDVKQNHRGKFVKIAEVTQLGQKMKLVMDMATAKEFHERLTEFSEYYSSLGPAKWDRSRMGKDEGKLKSDSIFREDRRYYLDLKENHRGRFLKVSMTLPNFERSQIVIPAQGILDIRDALTDVLREFDQDDAGGSSDVVANTDSVAAAQKTSSSDEVECVVIEGKKFSIEIGDSPRGKFVRISEVSPNFHTAITIPCQSWEKFVDVVEKATVVIKSRRNASPDC